MITICIPTYNRAKYLNECLYSLYDNLNIDKVEVIIADNDSIDDTESVIQAHINNKILRIKYIKNKTISPSLNWYSAIKRVRTAYFILLSDDDKIQPHFIDYFYEKYTYSNYSCILFSSFDIDNNDNVIRKKIQKNQVVDFHKFISKLSNFRIRYRLTSYVFMTEKIIKSNIFNYPWKGSGQFLDGAMIVESSKNGIIKIDSFVAAKYRVHQDNDSYKPNFNLINNARDVFFEYIKNNFQESRIKKKIYNWIIYGYIIQILRFLCKKNDIEIALRYINKKLSYLTKIHKIIIKIIIYILYYANTIIINISSKHK